jgi:hypothetical protein
MEIFSQRPSQSRVKPNPNNVGIKVDEDMTRMDTNITRTYLGRDMDDEYVICLCTTIRAKDKVSLFLCYLFTYFENRLLPKNIILIRNHGDDNGVLKDRHGAGEDQQETSNPS